MGMSFTFATICSFVLIRFTLNCLSDRLCDGQFVSLKKKKCLSFVTSTKFIQSLENSSSAKVTNVISSVGQGSNHHCRGSHPLGNCNGWGVLDLNPVGCVGRRLSSQTLCDTEHVTPK